MGTLFDMAGSPVPGVKLGLESIDGERLGATYTDDFGEFTLEGGHGEAVRVVLLDPRLPRREFLSDEGTERLKLVVAGLRQIEIAIRPPRALERVRFDGDWGSSSGWTDSLGECLLWVDALVVGAVYCRVGTGESTSWIEVPRSCSRYEIHR